ncbi:unnamed protein product [Nezara viridula]|uniref:Neuropeptide n=1 Tax=Nezara viridula TaxID=85310 RepID=A0A9P0MP40_NEZVI|nr:unnamed protein product [Nezara viridula]
MKLPCLLLLTVIIAISFDLTLAARTTRNPPGYFRCVGFFNRCCPLDRYCCINNLYCCRTGSTFAAIIC